CIEIHAVVCAVYQAMALWIKHQYCTAIALRAYPGSCSFLAPRLSVFSLPLRRGRARVGVKTSEVPKPCCSPHPNRSPRLRRRRAASLRAALPPPGGKGSKALGSEGKIET